MSRCPYIYIVNKDTHIYNMRNLELPYPLLHLLLHRLVRVQDRLLVDNYLCSVRLRSTDSRCNRCRVGLHDDTIAAYASISHLPQQKQIDSHDLTHPSSIVSSRQSRTRSRFSSTPRFSTWLRSSRCTASENATSAAFNMSSFSLGSPMM